MWHRIIVIEWILLDYHGYSFNLTNTQTAENHVLNKVSLLSQISHARKNRYYFAVAKRIIKKFLKYETRNVERKWSASTMKIWQISRNQANRFTGCAALQLAQPAPLLKSLYPRHKGPIRFRRHSNTHGKLSIPAFEQPLIQWCYCQISFSIHGSSIITTIACRCLRGSRVVTGPNDAVQEFTLSETPYPFARLSYAFEKCARSVWY